jgi:hypothetical protein
MRKHEFKPLGYASLFGRFAGGCEVVAALFTAPVAAKIILPKAPGFEVGGIPVVLLAQLTFPQPAFVYPSQNKAPHPKVRHNGWLLGEHFEALCNLRRVLDRVQWNLVVGGV